MNELTSTFYGDASQYLRDKVSQLLALHGSELLHTDGLNDHQLIELDPIGIIADSFEHLLDDLQHINHQLSLARSELRAIFDALGAAIMVLDRAGKLEDCNRQAREWFFDDVALEEIRGRTLSECCSCFSYCGENEAQPSPSTEFVCHERHYLRISSDVADESGISEKRVVLIFDLTQQKAAEADRQLFATVFNNTAEGIAITDSEFRYIRVNHAFCTITGYHAEELLGQKPSILQSGRHDSEFYTQMWQQLDEQGHWHGEIIDRTRDGRILPLLQTINKVRNEKGETQHYFSIITDISSLKETQSRLDFLAHHDVLTELPNRLLFNARLDHAISRSTRHSQPFALLFIDLDRFKTINDSLGHAVGDQILIEVALRLRELVRNVDTVARLGGDEFVVLLEQIQSHEQVEQLAASIVTTLRQPYQINANELHIGCSIGITFYPEDGTDAVILLRNADTAMYQMKASGRDGFCRYSHELTDAAHERLALENGLRSGIRAQQLVLHYQPIIDLTQQRIIGAEALVRWNHPQRGLLHPDLFITLAEESKLILPMGAWVAEEALRQLSYWLQEGITLDYLAINASSVQIFHPGFADDLYSLLEQYPRCANRLQVELTENVLLRDIQSCGQIMQQMRAQGIRIAIDDFGTGYSSLAYLKQLPIDDLKIDRSFIRDLSDDPGDAAIVKAIIHMAHALELKTVAEGVEDSDQERYLTAMGCNKVQGYHYAKPLPAEEFAAFYATFNALGDDRYRRF